MVQQKIGRNDPCPCGALKPDGTRMKYKRCCELKKSEPVPQEVLEYFMNNPPIPEPFEKGGFLTGRPFITETFQGMRMRAVANVIYRRPIDETFHQFVLNGLIQVGGWVLGIGDFFLAYLAINLVQRDISRRVAMIVAFSIAWFRFVFHVFFPSYSVALPYSLIITPITLMVYGWWIARRHASRT